MRRIHVEVSRELNARPEVVYALLADYRNGHPHILPKKYFRDLQVEAGGQGAGTIFRLRTVVAGSERRLHMQVSEPEPGRVLMERDIESGLVTTFSVSAVGEQGAKLKIATEWDASPGIVGVFEQMVVPPAMKRIYRQELSQLVEYLGSKQTTVSHG